MNKNTLVDICGRHILHDVESVVLKEPYIPYIPQPWNGVLVLAESQNLSSENTEHVETLREMSPAERILRLRASPDYVGVYPWDDGSLKLAIEASLQVKAAEVGVSNAVLWSQRGANGENVNPDYDIQQRSAKA